MKRKLKAWEGVFTNEEGKSCIKKGGNREIGKKKRGIPLKKPVE